MLLSAAARGDLPHDVDVPLLLDVAFGTLIFRRLRGAGDDVVVEPADLIASGAVPRRTRLSGQERTGGGPAVGAIFNA